MISVLFCNFIEKVYIKKENALFPGETKYSQRLTLTAKYLSSWSIASIGKAEEVLRARDSVKWLGQVLPAECQVSARPLAAIP